MNASDRKYALPVLPGKALVLRRGIPSIPMGLYVLLSNPAAPMVRLCRATRSEAGRIQVTDHLVHVPREYLRAFEAVPGIAVL